MSNKRAFGTNKASTVFRLFERIDDFKEACAPFEEGNCVAQGGRPDSRWKRDPILVKRDRREYAPQMATQKPPGTTALYNRCDTKSPTIMSSDS
jgi:hypothetical protein